MQRPDDKKRSAIKIAAVRLFSIRPFHEVLLEHVATKARISKGTVYTYFSSKEDLYDSIILEAFDEIMANLAAISEGEDDPWTCLKNMVTELMQWAFRNPNFYKMIMQSASDRVRPRLINKRKKLGVVFEQILHTGIERGVFADSTPALTAQYIPACVRAAVRYGPNKMDPAAMTDHLLTFLSAQLRKAPL